MLGVHEGWLRRFEEVGEEVEAEVDGEGESFEGEVERGLAAVFAEVTDQDLRVFVREVILVKLISGACWRLCNPYHWLEPQKIPINLVRVKFTRSSQGWSFTELMEEGRQVVAVAILSPAQQLYPLEACQTHSRILLNDWIL